MEWTETMMDRAGRAEKITREHYFNLLFTSYLFFDYVFQLPVVLLLDSSRSGPKMYSLDCRPSLTCLFPSHTSLLLSDLWN
jgi:hypothetical protein